MPQTSPSPAEPARASSVHLGLSFRAFVALIAAIMATNALGIDTMLPALPEIGRALGVADENDRQWIIAIYMLGFGAAQLVYGPLSDHYGRKRLLVGGLLLNAGCALLGALATSFPMLLAARFAQGVAAAAARVLVISVVRDCYAGRQMARVMSLSFMVFLTVPIVAPTLGQAVLAFGGWRDIFFVLAGFTALVAFATWRFLGETLRVEDRRPASFASVADGIRAVIGDRLAIGYTLASTLVFGALMGFINSVQQIFADEFHAPGIFPLVFAGVAGAMAVAAFTNSRIVERVGTRKVSHTALLGFIAAGAAHSLVAAMGYETPVTFGVLQGLSMFCFGLIGANFNSMAMERMGHIAGTASSVQGFLSTSLGAVIGLVIGQSFDGTALPMTLGFLVVGILALGVVLWTERGRLFRVQNVAAA